MNFNVLSGLMERLDAPPYDGKADLPVLSSDLQMPTDELLRATEAPHLLGFTEVSGGDVRLTPPARLFADHLLRNIPLAGRIRPIFQGRSTHVAPRMRFETELEDRMSEEEAEETLRAIISRARHTEIFAYDGNSEEFDLDAETVPSRPMPSPHPGGHVLASGQSTPSMTGWSSA